MGKPGQITSLRVAIGRRGGVDCRAEIRLDLKPLSVWGQLRDFQRYARQDPFHAEIQIDGGVPRPGAALRLTHCHVGLRVERIGRILWWREGVGYSFSDLSARGPRHGFPHVFGYRIHPLEDGSRTRLEIRVRGRWTAAWIPHWAARLWLWWVFLQITLTVRNELLAYQAIRRRRPL